MIRWSGNSTLKKLHKKPLDSLPNWLPAQLNVSPSPPIGYWPPIAKVSLFGTWDSELALLSFMKRNLQVLRESTITLCWGNR